MSATRKARYMNFANRVMQNNSPTLTFCCPHCKEAILTPAAPPGEDMDSLTTCPFCEGVFMKFTSDSDVITAVINDDTTVTWG